MSKLSDVMHRLAEEGKKVLQQGKEDLDEARYMRITTNPGHQDINEVDKAYGKAKQRRVPDKNSGKEIDL